MIDYVYFINLDEYRFWHGITNRQRGSSSLLTSKVLSVSRVWAMGEGVIFVAVAVTSKRELCVVVSFLVVWCLG